MPDFGTNVESAFADSLPRMETAPTDVSPEPPGESNVSSLRRALELLWAFRGVHVDLGLTELASRADIPKSTAFRLLRDLEAAGFVERSGTKYRLGLSLFELGSRVDIARPRGLRNSAIHAMTALHAETGLTLHLGVLKDDGVVLLDKLHGPRSPRIYTTAGQRLPATRTALGKALLAFAPEEAVDAALTASIDNATSRELFRHELDEVRERRIASGQEELFAGVICLAAPITCGGQAVGALSASMTSPRGSVSRLENLLRNSATEIGRIYNVNRLATT